jgi:hypothetical protein
MRWLLMFTLFSFANGLIKQMIGNSLLNANEKMCKKCIHFMPQTMKEGELPIGDYYGKCGKFVYKYFIDDEEDYDNKFAIYCRLNDKLCGKGGKYYEEK